MTLSKFQQLKKIVQQTCCLYSLMHGRLHTACCLGKISICRYQHPIAYVKAIHSDQHYTHIENWQFSSSLYNWPDYKNAGTLTPTPLPLFPIVISKFLSFLLKSVSLIVYCSLIQQYTQYAYGLVLVMNSVEKLIIQLLQLSQINPINQ